MRFIPCMQSMMKGVYFGEPDEECTKTYVGSLSAKIDLK